MKSKGFLKQLIILIAVIFITAIPAYCAPVSIKETAIKFLLAMGGVALSSFIIFAGLSIYNKLFVERRGMKFDKDDSLSTPNNIDDAVTFFIKKNKLR